MRSWSCTFTPNIFPSFHPSNFYFWCLFWTSFFSIYLLSHYLLSIPLRLRRVPNNQGIQFYNALKSFGVDTRLGGGAVDYYSLGRASLQF